MKLELKQVTYSLRRPVITARATMEARQGWQVRFAHDGLVGRGEAFPLHAFGTESVDACRRALESFEPEPIDSIDELPVVLAPLDGTPAARFAVESALLEWLACKRGTPVAPLLGEGRASVPVNALIEGADAEALATEAKKAVDAGFRTVKIKVASRSVSIDAQRIHAVRLAVGPKVAIRIDANGGWSEGTARSALRGLEALDIEVCEQPVAAHDVDGLRRVTELVPVSVAADESLSDPAMRERLLRRYPIPAVRVLVLKPAVLGGVLPALELARAAHQVGVESYATTTMDGPIARAAAAHLAAALPGARHAHGLSTVELFRDLPRDGFSPKDGDIHLPSVPGWGV